MLQLKIETGLHQGNRSTKYVSFPQCFRHYLPARNRKRFQLETENSLHRGNRSTIYVSFPQCFKCKHKSRDGSGPLYPRSLNPLLQIDKQTWKPMNVIFHTLNTDLQMILACSIRAHLHTFMLEPNNTNWPTPRQQKMRVKEYFSNRWFLPAL